MNGTASRERVRVKRTEKPVPTPPGSKAMTSSEVHGIYRRFWELPVALVLAVLWMTGAVLLGLCAFALYLVVTALV
jgi:hypothetical protein